MSVCYNDNDAFVCDWLRNLAAAGVIPKGKIDDRPIEQVRPAEVAGFDQVHFFAGIGGWAEALRLAGWTGRPVWTGSCPCQPFSVAGNRRGTDDPRHLWPAWFRLVSECRPVTILGEQVASKDGRLWFDAVARDLEGEGYAVGAAVLGAHSVGAPHCRQRLYFVAHTVGQPIGAGLEGHAGDGADRRKSGRIGAEADGSVAQAGANPWAAAVPIHCQDGKARFVEPGICPLAHGIPGRVGRLRGYGNAIVPQVAALFVRSFMETHP